MAKFKRYSISFKIEGTNTVISAYIDMSQVRADNLLSAFGMKEVEQKWSWLPWKPKMVHLTWDELEENGQPVHSPIQIHGSFKRLEAAGWILDDEAFVKYHWGPHDQ